MKTAKDVQNLDGNKDDFSVLDPVRNISHLKVNQDNQGNFIPPKPKPFRRHKNPPFNLPIGVQKDTSDANHLKQDQDPESSYDLYDDLLHAVCNVQATSLGSTFGKTKDNDFP